MTGRRRPLLATALLAAFAAGAGTACGVPVSSAPQVVQDVPAGLMLPATTTHIRPVHHSKGVFDIYLVTGAQLFIVARTGSPTPQTLLAALDAGPLNFEASEGITTDLPAGAHVTIVKIRGHVATVNLDASFGAFSSLLGVAQIVYTVVDELKGVTQVAFFQAGTRVDAPTEDGTYVSRPLDTADFARYRPGGIDTQLGASTTRVTTAPKCSLAVGGTCH